MTGGREPGLPSPGGGQDRGLAQGGVGQVRQTAGHDVLGKLEDLGSVLTQPPAPQLYSCAHYMIPYVAGCTMQLCKCN